MVLIVKNGSQIRDYSSGTEKSKMVSGCAFLIGTCCYTYLLTAANKVVFMHVVVYPLVALLVSMSLHELE